MLSLCYLAKQKFLYFSGISDYLTNINVFFALIFLWGKDETSLREALKFNQKKPQPDL